MDLLTLIRIVLRRWYVTMPVLLVAFGLALYVQSTIPEKYEARGSVLLEDPRLDPSRLPASFVHTGAILDRFEESDAPTVVATGDTRVVPRPRDRWTLEITAVGSDPNDVESSVRATMDWVSAEVANLQDEEDVAEEERLRVSILTPAVAAEPQPGGNYEAVGEVILRDPADGIDNPYTAGGGTTSLLQAVVGSDSGRARVNERTAPGVGFDIATTRDNASIIMITTTGSDPAALFDAFDVVRDALASELDARQERAGVLESRRIIITDLARPQAVVDVSPPLSRAVAAIIGLGGLVALGLAVAVESIADRRQNSQMSRRGDALQQWWFEPDSSTGFEHPKSHGAPTGSEAGATTDEGR